MAEAYLGTREDDPARTSIVLKRIRPDLANDKEYHRRFVLEAQVASRLSHPNLVRFREFGRVGDCHYIAMDHVRGYSLHRLLDPVFKQGVGPSAGAAISIGAGILDGLGEMHSVRDDTGRPRPMLHRDVTPKNVIVDHEGRPVIIDFGITKDVMGPAITLPGRVIGTARYMAPEHRKAEYIDTRADVFSASVIIYELLTAQPPWPPMDGMKELLRFTFDPPEVPESAAQRVPDDVLSVVLKGLACEPADRWSNAFEMSEALKSCGCYEEVMGAGPQAVVQWVQSLELPADETLGTPVLDHLGDGATEVTWSSTGALTTKDPASASNRAAQGAKRPEAKVLDVPPLPPRRDAALATEDLEALTGPPEGRRPWVLPAFLGLALVVCGAIAYAMIHG